MSLHTGAAAAAGASQLLLLPLLSSGEQLVQGQSQCHYGVNDDKQLMMFHHWNADQCFSVPVITYQWQSTDYDDYQQ